MNINIGKISKIYDPKTGFNYQNISPTSLIEYNYIHSCYCRTENKGSCIFCKLLENFREKQSNGLSEEEERNILRKKLGLDVLDIEFVAVQYKKLFIFTASNKEKSIEEWTRLFNLDFQDVGKILKITRIKHKYEIISDKNTKKRYLCFDSLEGVKAFIMNMKNYI